jgi:hypothetical protein
MTGYESKKAMARDKLLELAQEGMSMHSHDAPEYIVCEALIGALAQPKVRTGDCLLCGVCASEGHKIQAQRPWVGLTDEEMETTFIECGGKWTGDYWKIEDANFHPFLRTIEAKLKEKNNG